MDIKLAAGLAICPCIKLTLTANELLARSNNYSQTNIFPTYSYHIKLRFTTRLHRNFNHSQKSGESHSAPMHLQSPQCSQSQMSQKIGARPYASSFAVHVSHAALSSLDFPAQLSHIVVY